MPFKIPWCWGIWVADVLFTVPVTGIMVKPIIGAICEGTRFVRFGRKKPFFLFGAVITRTVLVLMPYVSNIWMAASLSGI